MFSASQYEKCEASDYKADLSLASARSIIRAWFNRFAAQPRQFIFKEKILFSESITFV
jgi:hypothetical protein